MQPQVPKELRRIHLPEGYHKGRMFALKVRCLGFRGLGFTGVGVHGLSFTASFVRSKALMFFQHHSRVWGSSSWVFFKGFCRALEGRLYGLEHHGHPLARSP